MKEPDGPAQITTPDPITEIGPLQIKTKIDIDVKTLPDGDKDIKVAPGVIIEVKEENE